MALFHIEKIKFRNPKIAEAQTTLQERPVTCKERGTRGLSAGSTLASRQMRHPITACNPWPTQRNAAVHFIEQRAAGHELTLAGLRHYQSSDAPVLARAIGPHPFEPIQGRLNGRVYPIEFPRDPLGSSQHQSGIGPKVMQMAPDPSPRMPASPRTKLRDVVATATPQRAIDEQKLAR